MAESDHFIFLFVDFRIMVKIETDERIKRANFGSTISNEAGRIKGWIDTTIEDYSSLLNKDYIKLIESYKSQASRLIQSFDIEIKRVESGR